MIAEQLPAPIITDLDSDGINEIVLVTNDLKLSVLVLPDAESRDEDDQTLPHVDVKHKVVLPKVLQNNYMDHYLRRTRCGKKLIGHKLLEARG